MANPSHKLPLTHEERANLRALEEIKYENGANLINRLEQLYGYWEDPCLEDSLRCIVHHANNPEDEKNWFDFTEERKRYRQQYGYPITRPKLAWHEVKKDNGE